MIIGGAFYTLVVASNLVSSSVIQIIASASLVLVGRKVRQHRVCTLI